MKMTRLRLLVLELLVFGAGAGCHLAWTLPLGLAVLDGAANGVAYVGTVETLEQLKHHLAGDAGATPNP